MEDRTTGNICNNCESKPVDIICEQCSSELCMDCSQVIHQHKIMQRHTLRTSNKPSIMSPKPKLMDEDATEAASKTINDLIQRMQDKLELLQNFAQKNSREEQQLFEKMLEIKSKIKTLHDALSDNIHKIVQMLLKMVEDEEEKGKGVLAISMEQLEEEILKIDTLIKDSSGTVTGGSPDKVLQLKYLLQDAHDTWEEKCQAIENDLPNICQAAKTSVNNFYTSLAATTNCNPSNLPNSDYTTVLHILTGVSITAKELSSPKESSSPSDRQALVQDTFDTNGGSGQAKVEGNQRDDIDEDAVADGGSHAKFKKNQRDGEEDEYEDIDVDNIGGSHAKLKKNQSDGEEDEYEDIDADTIGGSRAKLKKNQRDEEGDEYDDEGEEADSKGKSDKSQSDEEEEEAGYIEMVDWMTIKDEQKDTMKKTAKRKYKSCIYENTHIRPRLLLDRTAVEYSLLLHKGDCREIWKGTVYGYPAAVSVLNIASVEQDDLLFQATHLATIQHQHLATILICLQGEPYLVTMELFPQGSLLDFIKEDMGGTLGLRLVLQIASQIAAGMAYLEEIDLAHGHLKSSTIFVSISDPEQFKVKVALCPWRRAARDFTPPIRWAAPELLRDGREGLSLMADVWSFAIVIVEMVILGALPYEGMTDLEVSEKVQAGYCHPSPSNKNFEFPEDLYEVMIKCWSQDPNQRPRFEFLHTHTEDLYHITPEDYINPADWKDVC